MRLGAEWFRDRPEESELIARNLRDLGLADDEGVVARIREHIVLHYYEKLLPLCGDPAYYHRFLADTAEVDGAVGRLTEAAGAGRGVLLAVPHFGAVELIAPALAARSLPVTAVLRFKTPELSAMANAHVRRMAESGLFREITFIEIGKPGTNAALDMAAVLRRGEILLSVFDERTEYSVPVKLMGRTVWGGAGLDKLISFAGASIDIHAAFMLRESLDRCSLHLRGIDPQGGNPIQQLYDELESMLAGHLEQWYFLHEEIPFV
jgi:lauroyl/myristoyl acyltransferase